MAISLSPAERETVMQVDDETMEWVVWTCQQRMMTKFNNAGWEQYNAYKEGNRILSCEYRLPFNAVTIRSKKSVERKHEPTLEQLAGLQKARRTQKAQIDSKP